MICTTSLLSISYLEGGPRNGAPVLLLHGWPDDPQTWDRIAPALNRAGYRTFAPWLRGFGATRLSPDTFRSGQMIAMAQDALEFMDAVGVDRFAVHGHDWGARIAYILASLYPERVKHCVAMSVGWAPGAFQTPSMAQARAFWYQWFMATDRGVRFVREHGVAFARCQWDTWSPPGWFDEAAFAATAKSFKSRLGRDYAARIPGPLGRSGAGPCLHRAGSPADGRTIDRGSNTDDSRWRRSVRVTRWLG